MNYGMIIAMVISFWLTYFTLPPAIKKLKETGHVVKDRYKPSTPRIPSQGGVVLLFTVFLTLISISLWFRAIHQLNADVNLPKDLSQTDMAILLVATMFAVYGIVDDLLDLGHLPKVILPLFFSYPLLSIISHNHITVPFIGVVDFGSYMELPFIGKIYLSTFYYGVMMPIFIIVIPNLVNMHSGFNGLQTGLSSIILATIIIKSILDDRPYTLLVPSAMLGGLVALWLFNKYPAKILEGNIGSLFVGSTIGCVLIVQGYLLFGFVIFIPHTIDFLMFLSLKIRKKRFVKFGSVREDGTLEVPNPIKMKFLLPYYFRMTERQTVYCMYGITIAFCILGLILPS